MAPVSKPIVSSPEEEPSPPKRDEIDELDNEPVPERPRLSLPIDEDTGEIEEGSPEPPPRLSLAFDEEDITQRSVEYPRRAMSEQDRARLSRMSFGDVRLSENFGDLSRLDGASETGDVTTLQQGNDEEAQEDTTLGQGAFDAGYVKDTCHYDKTTRADKVQEEKPRISDGLIWNSISQLPLVQARLNLTSPSPMMKRTSCSTRPMRNPTLAFHHLMMTTLRLLGTLGSTSTSLIKIQMLALPESLVAGYGMNLSHRVEGRRSFHDMVSPFRTSLPEW